MIIHGSIQGVPFTLTQWDGTPITDPTGITTILVPGGQDWETGTGKPAVALGGQLCHMLDGTETVGTYTLYVRDQAAPPELPVVSAGSIYIG